MWFGFGFFLAVVWFAFVVALIAETLIFVGEAKQDKDRLSSPNMVHGRIQFVEVGNWVMVGFLALGVLSALFMTPGYWDNTSKSKRSKSKRSFEFSFEHYPSEHQDLDGGDDMDDMDDMYDDDMNDD
jgi:hypothetical protein